VQAHVKDGYDHSQPDADIVEKLRSVNWDKPVMFFVGALTAGKGVQSLLMALPRIFKSVPDAQLIVVGAGAYREGLEAFQHALATGNRALLTKLVEAGFDFDRSHMKGGFEDLLHFMKDDAAVTEALGAGEKMISNVKFVGRINHDLLQFLFPCIDIATFPSVVAEAYPLVLMESLSNGVLPLVSDFSGFKNGLDDLEQYLGKEWVDRLRIPNDNDKRVSEIAHNLTATLQDPDLSKMGPRLREIAVEHYDWKVRADQVAGAMRTTIAHAQAKSSS
jgi:glycosyltransferase involved in cell wall biosynthesis